MFKLNFQRAAPPTANFVLVVEMVVGAALVTAGPAGVVPVTHRRNRCLRRRSPDF